MTIFDLFQTISYHVESIVYRVDLAEMKPHTIEISRAPHGCVQRDEPSRFVSWRHNTHVPAGWSFEYDLPSLLKITVSTSLAQSTIIR